MVPQSRLVREKWTFPRILRILLFTNLRYLAHVAQLNQGSFPRWIKQLPSLILYYKSKFWNVEQIYLCINISDLNTWHYILRSVILTSYCLSWIRILIYNVCYVPVMSPFSSLQLYLDIYILYIHLYLFFIFIYMIAICHFHLSVFRKTCERCLDQWDSCRPSGAID